MPKRKAVRGKRGGGSAGRKAAQAAAAKSDDTEVTTDVNSSSVTAVGLESETAEEDLEAIDEDPGPEQTFDESQSFKPDEAECVLDLETISELNNSASKEEGTSEYGLNKENLETVADKCEQLEVIAGSTQLKGTPEIETQVKSVENDSGLAITETHDSQEDEYPLTELQEEEMLAAVDNTEENNAELGFVDKEAESDQKEMEEVQYIDEEACEDQQLSDIMESLSNTITNMPQNSETPKDTDKEIEGEKLEKLDKECEIPAELIKSSTVESQKNEEIDSSKFEEISEGSIDQDHEEFAVEAISDVEITGETYSSKKTENNNVQDGQSSVHYNEAESLEEVFFATENDDARITAEDKDNDDISDGSLSDHDETNLSLEEISDDDLEPSKKKKKPSGMTPIKTEKIDDSAKSDAENGTKLEENADGTKTNQISTTIQKRPATDDTGGPEQNSSKRLKVSSAAKGSEETSRNDNTSYPLTASGEIKKEGKKAQAKEPESSHNRNVLKRNPSQPSKSEQQENRERSLPSRDVAEHRRRYELASSGCQTEPRLFKGKIVQCNINPIKSALEPGQFGIYSERGVTGSKLLKKFRDKVPPSIPEKVFTEVTSLQSPHKANTFSFSIGPVMLSDMDSPKFRDVLRCAEGLNLAFDNNGLGVWKASVASHESLSSLIKQLKLLELETRYMVMSVVYRHGSEISSGVWKATIMFLYEQDAEKENQNLVVDAKVRAKLCLKGVPKDVSKDFIHLLFPEAINVGSGPRTFDDRAVVLGFTNTKMVEQIISSSHLFVICGTQINMSDIDASEPKPQLPTDITNESVDLVLEDTKQGEVSEQPVICIDLELEKEREQQDVLGPSGDGTAQNENKDSTQNKELDSCNSDPTTAGDLADALSFDQGNHVIDAEGKEALRSGTDSCKKATQVTEETSVVETVSTSEHAEINVYNIQDTTSTKPADDLLTLQTKKDKLESGEMDVIILDDDDDINSAVSQGPDVATVLDDQVSDTTNTGNKNIGEVIKKPDAAINDDTNTTTEAELLENTEAPTDGGDCVSRDTPKDKVCNTTDMVTEDKNSEKKVNVLKKEASRETTDENLEDVSDDEMVNQSKNEDQEDVVIVKEDSTQWVAANIDLTNEESNASGKLLNESTKDLADEKSKQHVSPAGAIKTNDDSIKTSPKDKDSKNVDSKLVMTDDGLEVLMEVIDVSDGNQEVDKVIYARTWWQPRDRSRERNRWDASHYRSTPYVHMPWRENPPWSYTSRPDPYNNSQNPSRYYPAREGVARIPKHYSGSSREGSPNLRAPSREETSHRRFSYYAKHKRNLSPSPKRDVNIHGHSSSHTTDHRTNVADHWDKRYDHWRPSAYGDSRKTESYSRPAAESGSRLAHVPSRSTAYHSSHTWRDSHHDSAKTGDRYSHNNSRGAHYRDRRHDYRKSRSRSYSDLSASSGEQFPPVRKSSYRRESPRRSALRISRSPISVSSRSRSLSPVSKSPSIEYAQAEAGKEELVKTVKHFLELAKGLQQAQKRRSIRSRSPKSPPLRHSKSPLPVRLSSPRKAGRSSRHAELQSPHRRSRSPPAAWSRVSRSPSYTRTRKHKYDRSPSPSSPGGKHKRHRSDRSYSDRKEKSHRKESESPPRRYESKRSQRTGESSKPYEEQGSSKSKSGQSSDPKYRSSGDQSWQQSSSGYQAPQSSGHSSTSNIYNPAYPPPGMYSGSSVPAYSYNSTSQYNYSSIPPPYVQPVPPPQVSQSYQSSYSAYQTSQSYSTSGHHSASLQTGVSSNNTSSKNKKSWSMGNSALAFQRVLGSSKGDRKGKSGIIEKVEDRERLERPKYNKQERVLASVQMEKK